MAKAMKPAPVELPRRAFLFTVDQIATLLSVEEQTVFRQYLFYEGRDVGARPKDKMVARNIARQGEKPDWRIAEREFMRWMRVKGFRYYERGYYKS